MSARQNTTASAWSEDQLTSMNWRLRVTSAEQQLRKYEEIGLIDSMKPVQSTGGVTDGWKIRIAGRWVPLTLVETEAWLAGAEAAARFLAHRFGVAT